MKTLIAVLSLGLLLLSPIAATAQDAELENVEVIQSPEAIKKAEKRLRKAEKAQRKAEKRAKKLDRITDKIRKQEKQLDRKLKRLDRLERNLERDLAKNKLSEEEVIKARVAISKAKSAIKEEEEKLARLRKKL